MGAFRNVHNFFLIHLQELLQGICLLKVIETNVLFYMLTVMEKAE